MQMSGTTGSGKSLILETLQQRGEQVVKRVVKKFSFASLISLNLLNGCLV